MVIAIDAGHGGGDSGVPDNDRGVLEKDATLATALTYKYFFTMAGHKVLMSRTKDVQPTYRQRSNLGNEADLFISVHYNSVGTYGLIYHEKNDWRAKEFGKIALKRLGLSRLWSSDVSKWGRLYIDDVSCPAIIHEVAAIDHYPTDPNKARDMRIRNAVKMLLAIEDYGRAT